MSSGAATKSEAEGLHRSLLKALKSAVAGDKPSAQLLNVARQFVRDAGIQPASAALVGDGKTPEDVTSDLEELENFEFPHTLPQ